MQLQRLFEKSATRLAQRNGYRPLDWQIRAGEIALRIPSVIIVRFLTYDNNNHYHLHHKIHRELFGMEKHADPDCKTLSAAESSRIRHVRSADLFQDGRCLIIEHAGESYCLRLTRNERLILTKN